MIVQQRKQSSFDEIKHSLRMIEGIIEVLILSGAYYLVWDLFYRDDGRV